VAVGGLEEAPEGQDETPELDEADRERLTAAVADLPDEFRVVVLMFYFEELSYQEIAGELEIPIGTVMSRLSRGKGHLRRKLETQKVAGTLRVPSAASTGNGVGRTPSARVNP
jgi:RNA polymerase sigma-70 factor (ECF subfamily)